MTVSRSVAPRVEAGMDRETELALVGRLREGNEAAFDAVYDAYRAPLFAFLRRLCRRRDVAEDLLEETWLRLVTHADALKEDTCLGAWLFTVARNLFWSACRSHRLREGSAVELLGLWPLADPGPSPFEAAVAGELEERLERALAELPARHREVLLLVAAVGLTPAEAAQSCGVTSEAMRQRLSRARAALAEALEPPRPARRPRLEEVPT